MFCNDSFTENVYEHAFFKDESLSVKMPKPLLLYSLMIMKHLGVFQKTRKTKNLPLPPWVEKGKLPPILRKKSTQLAKVCYMLWYFCGQGMHSSFLWSTRYGVRIKKDPQFLHHHQQLHIIFRFFLWYNRSSFFSLTFRRPHRFRR